MLARFDLKGIQKEMKGLMLSVDNILDAIASESKKMFPNRIEVAVQ